MTNFEKKENKVLDNISSILSNLDDTLNKLDGLYSDDSKQHTFKKWYEEKKATHEIKKILNQEGKYDNYLDKELDGFEKNYSEWLED